MSNAPIIIYDIPRRSNPQAPEQAPPELTQAETQLERKRRNKRQQRANQKPEQREAAKAKDRARWHEKHPIPALACETETRVIVVQSQEKRGKGSDITISANGTPHKKPPKPLDRSIVRVLVSAYYREPDRVARIMLIANNRDVLGNIVFKTI